MEFVSNGPWKVSTIGELIACMNLNTKYSNGCVLALDKAIKNLERKNKSLYRANTILCLSVLGLAAVTYWMDCDIKALKLKVAELENDNIDLNNAVYNTVINTKDKDEEM